VVFAISVKRKPWAIFKLNTESVSGSAWDDI
jgi:hypothetical protein